MGGGLAANRRVCPARRVPSAPNVVEAWKWKATRIRSDIQLFLDYMKFSPGGIDPDNNRTRKLTD